MEYKCIFSNDVLLMKEGPKKQNEDVNYSLWAVKWVIGLYDCGLRTGRGQTDVKKGHYAVKSGLMNPFPVRRQWRRIRGP